MKRDIDSFNKNLTAVVHFTVRLNEKKSQDQS